MVASNTQNLIVGLAALAAVADDVQVVQPNNGNWQGLKKARVVGHDNGKPPIKMQPRNAQCACGSGRKAKRCCNKLGN